MRIGYGYDVHRLVPGKKLVLGGVVVPSDLGLAGHSDADVLLHAIVDALLGAAAMGDIGQHFPDTDPRYEGADSRLLLARVSEMIRDAGFVVANVDATVVAERPRLAPHVPAMRSAVAATLSLDATQISIKATTSEGLGFVGAGEGIAAHAVCLIMEEQAGNG